MSEATIFELSRKGRGNNYIPIEDDIEGNVEDLLGRRNLRTIPADLPEMPENEVMRHFIRLSALNHHIDKPTTITVFAINPQRKTFPSRSLRCTQLPQTPLLEGIEKSSHPNETPVSIES